MLVEINFQQKNLKQIFNGFYNKSKEMNENKLDIATR